jgi:integrase
VTGEDSHTRGSTSRKEARAQGSIRRRGNSFQVLVYSGFDPLTGRRLYLSESTTDEAEAKRILNKFQAQVDDQINTRTRTLFRVEIEEWLKFHEFEETTRDGYEMYARNYINPALGNEPVSKISARVLEQFYAELRRRRTRCDCRPAIDHREDGPHECRVVRYKRPPGRPPAGAIRTTTANRPDARSRSACLTSADRWPARRLQRSTSS